MKMEGVRPKEQIALMNAMVEQSVERNPPKVEGVEELVREKGFRAEYKVVEKTLTQAVMNW